MSWFGEMKERFDETPIGEPTGGFPLSFLILVATFGVLYLVAWIVERKADDEPDLCAVDGCHNLAPPGASSCRGCAGVRTKVRETEGQVPK